MPRYGKALGIHEGINLKLEMLKMKHAVGLEEAMERATTAATKATMMIRKRPPVLRASYSLPGELVVDCFAGGGGASTGMERALGRPVDIAINHDAQAIAMHEANHPFTRHFQNDIWEVDPLEATKGKPVGIAWFSPDCTHFSKAKGSQPRKQGIRDLAWVVVKWAKAVRPRVIMLENVCEFEGWGPLDENGRPIKARKGEIFREWVQALRDLGYVVEWRRLVASEYGVPTIRERLYLVARCDGQPIVWPKKTHGEGMQPFVHASEIIDWSLPCPSIFTEGRDLVEATLKRIAKGVQRYVIDAQEPFIIRHGHYSTITGAGMTEGCGAGTWRGQVLNQPLSTVCATNDRHLVVPHLAKHYGGVVGHDVKRAIGTITAKDHHAVVQTLLERWAGCAPNGEREAEVYAFLSRYNGNAGAGMDLRDPLCTLTSKARFSLVTVLGVEHMIKDIGMRMLVPREQYRAQGFEDSYDITTGPKGKKLSVKAQTHMAGNSVCPPMADYLTQCQVGAAVGVSLVA